MPHRKYIVTNFAYGTGPYIHTTHLAISVNNALEKIGHERLKIIVPLVYGDKQKQIMDEEFGEFLKQHQKEIILDEPLGRTLKKLFYGDNTYEESLIRWIRNVDGISAEIKNHLHRTYRGDISIELHRSPRASYGIAPSYFTSFGYLSEIYEKSIGNKEIAVDDRLLEEAIPKISEIEKNHRIHFLSDPGTFSYLNERKKRFPHELHTPPLMHPPKRHHTASIEKGVYVTVTGIPGLYRIYQEARRLGIKLYTNNIQAIPSGKKMLPHSISHPNIMLHFARSGWGAIWTSQLAHTPIILPPWDRHDDPEIYFNNICVQKLGLGIIYNGEPFEELLENTEPLRSRIEKYNKHLHGTYGTCDGLARTAEKIADDFINKV